MGSYLRSSFKIKKKKKELSHFRYQNVFLINSSIQSSTLIVKQMNKGFVHKQTRWLESQIEVS